MRSVAARARAEDGAGHPSQDSFVFLSVLSGSTFVYFVVSAFGGTWLRSAATSFSFAAAGNLSAFAQTKLTCHICVVDNDVLKPGIPVIRIPPDTFQYVSPGSSSVTPLPSINFGGTGNIPFAIAVCGAPGTP